MRRVTIAAAAFVSVAALAIGATPAAAADTPPLADDVAARLGIAPDKLRAALREAIAARIDAAVEAGMLTPERGAGLKERLANAKRLGLRLRGRLAMKHPRLLPGMRLRAHRLGPISTYLGVTPRELHSELRAGKSLAQIATAHGKSGDGLVAAIVAPAKARLERAVSNGRLTQQRADAILGRLTDAVETMIQRSRPAS